MTLKSAYWFKINGRIHIPKHNYNLLCTNFQFATVWKWKPARPPIKDTRWPRVIRDNQMEANTICMPPSTPCTFFSIAKNIHESVWVIAFFILPQEGQDVCFIWQPYTHEPCCMSSIIPLLLGRPFPALVARYWLEARLCPLTLPNVETEDCRSHM